MADVLKSVGLFTTEAENAPSESQKPTPQPNGLSPEQSAQAKPKR